MTTAEAHALAARLERVWGVDENCKPETRLDGDYFKFEAYVERGRIGFDEMGNRYEAFAIAFVRVHGIGGDLDYRLSYRSDALHLNKGEVISLRSSTQAQFAAQWLPFFRRGCFLSGANIEATAHEKMEWSQGFEKEVKEWGLCF